LQAKPTEAVYTLKDPTEVQTFLSKIIAWGHTPANAWHVKQSCTGWALDPSLVAHRVNGYLTPSDGGDTPRSGAHTLLSRHWWFSKIYSPSTRVFLTTHVCWEGMLGLMYWDQHCRTVSQFPSAHDVHVSS
jgi:hypothetical protein